MSRDPIVIMGASSGFGAALARELDARGHLVVAGARSASDLGGGVHYLQVDVTSETEVADFFTEASSRFGEPRGFVYCPADSSAVGYGWEVPSDEVARVIDVTFLGFARCLPHVVPGMYSRGRGSVLAIGSRGARVPVPALAAYCAAKAALEQYIRCLAEELSNSSVRVNALGIAGETPLSRDHLNRKEKALELSTKFPELPDVRDNLPFACFLLSDDASYVSGQVMDARPPAWT